MTDAPEKIWTDPDIDDHFNPARPDWTGGQWYIDKYKGPKSTSYTRTDIAEAAYRRGLERAAEIVENPIETNSRRIAAAIRAEIGKPDAPS